MKTKNRAPSPFSSEDGLELRGSLSLAEKPCRSFSSGQLRRRRQLHEHESPGETALLTGYLLGSREGGTYSPLNLNQLPSSAFFYFAPQPGDKICGYSLFLEHAAGVEDDRASPRSFPSGERNWQAVEQGVDKRFKVDVRSRYVWSGNWLIRLG